MIHEDLGLAGQCFQKVQFCNPEWPMGWLGQSFIANILGSAEAFELTEHTFQLGGSSEVSSF